MGLLDAIMCPPKVAGTTIHCIPQFPNEKWPIFFVSTVRQTQQTVKYYQKWPRKVESNISYKGFGIYLPWILPLWDCNITIDWYNLHIHVHIIYIIIMLREEVNGYSASLTKGFIGIALHSLIYVSGSECIGRCWQLPSKGARFVWYPSVCEDCSNKKLEQ